MHAETFIKLIEEEYAKVFREAEKLRNERGFNLYEKPAFICRRIEKFRNWLTIAIRCADLVHDGIGVKPEDVLVRAASVCFDKTSGNFLHPCLMAVLSLFDREQFDAIFGETRRLTLEQRTAMRFSECKFQVCYSHCQFVKNGPQGMRQDSTRIDREAS